MIPVVFSSDHDFVMPTGVALLSLLRHSHDSEIDIYILHDNSLVQDDKDKLKAVCELGGCKYCLSFIPMGDMFKSAYENRGVTHAAYYRLVIPWLFPKIDKLVYCDGDVIFKKSIKDLYEISIGDYYGAGVKRYQYDRYSYKKYAQSLGVDPSEYINSGVMVINCDMMRKDNLKPRFDELASNKYKYFDQDIINIVCKDKLFSLPFIYNVMPTMDIPEDDVCIIHYAGLKPWKSFTRHWYDWWSVYRESPFYDKTLEMSIASRPLSVKQSIKVWIKWHYPSLYKKLRELIGEIPA